MKGRRLRGWGWRAVLGLSLLGALMAGLAPVASARRGPLPRRPAAPRILVLSSRADVVAGGEALVQVVLPDGNRLSRVKISLGGRVVNRSFARRPNGKFEGLVTGLRVGKNVLRVMLPSGRGARITITNHPIGGPVFSGPQIQPWTCQAGALDKQCNEPPQYSYLYESSDPSKPGLQPYDPQNPPSDVAMTTTDTGATVPFIVREETGFEDRDAYRIEVLYEPGKPWAPWAPQRQFAHKLLIMQGMDCFTAYEPKTPPWGDGAGAIPANPAIEDSSQVALGKGFAVMSTTLNDSQYDCDPALQAESVVIAKQHLIDELGPLAYTIGTGCSGGSLSQQWVANAYPGIYQGLIPQCSFPDAGTAIMQAVDLEAMDNYFESPSAAAAGWTPAQEAEVADTGVENLPVPAESNALVVAFWWLLLPNQSSSPEAIAVGGGPPCAPLSSAQLYDPQTNPGGVRCGWLDWNINLFGPQPPSVWDEQEKEVGHGFAANPADNVGVQYGLGALNAGQITPSQFLSLNANAGGFNIDWQPKTQRMVADHAALANAYRTGIFNEANNLNQVAIINLTGPNDPAALHETFRAFALRARLDRNFGTHLNQLIWEGPTPLIGDAYYFDEALLAMDRWLEGVQKDPRSKSQAAKIIADKPKDITDQCSNGDGAEVSATLCPSSEVPVYGTPRMVAGDAITTDNDECALGPLDRTSYKVTFTDAEWAQMQQIFPTGVCNYSKPGVSQQPAIPWMTYQTAQGKAIYGGRPLGPAPVSQPFASGRRGGHTR